MLLRKLLFFLLWFGCHQAMVWAQAVVIHGEVKDSLTREPVPFATVFIAGTTMGTSTNAEGKFRFEVPGPGHYELVVSSIGFHPWEYLWQAQPGKSYRFEVPLRPQVRELAGVTVSARAAKVWRERARLFKKRFLGQSLAGRRSKILNLTDLEFVRQEDLLRGYCDRPLVIENRQLGYRLHFVLQSFVYDYQKQYSSFLGKPRFEEMKPSGEKERQRWAKNRQKAYQGSFQHFLDALVTRRLAEEGFEVAHVHRDSTNRIALVKGVDRLYDFCHSTDNPVVQQFDFEGDVRVAYLKEPEESEYASIVGNLRPATVQSSTLRMYERPGLLSRDGYLLNPLSFLLMGYWAYEQVGEMLPYEYEGRIIGRRS